MIALLFVAPAQRGRKEKYMNYTETEREIIKSFAYGYTPEQVAENYGVTVEDARNMQKNFTSAIEEKKEYLKEQGWM